jgi:hypothetical protein
MTIKQRGVNTPGGTDMSEKYLSASIEFVKSKSDELLAEYKNKYLLVFDAKVVGSFDTYEAAAAEGVRVYGLEAPFLVYHMLEGEPLNFIMSAAL